MSFPVFTTFWKLVLIQLILATKMQTINQMEDIVHGSLLFESIFQITSEKWSNLFLKIPFFEADVEIHKPLVLKGLRVDKFEEKTNSVQSNNGPRRAFRCLLSSTQTSKMPPNSGRSGNFWAISYVSDLSNYCYSVNDPPYCRIFCIVYTLRSNQNCWKAFYGTVIWAHINFDTW